jgi:hypothetical protein
MGPEMSLVRVEKDFRGALHNAGVELERAYRA